jgi:maltose alpha-D-glucosyltransferase/alpha-amylase
VAGRSVFYEVMVRSFVDSNGDGSGDPQGLLSKLDYLQWLGIDALWASPVLRSRRFVTVATTCPESRHPARVGTPDEFTGSVTKSHGAQHESSSTTRSTTLRTSMSGSSSPA